MRSPIGHFTSNRYAVPAPLLRCPFTPPDLIAREGAYLQHDLASRNPRNTRCLAAQSISSSTVHQLLRILGSGDHS